MLKQAGIPATPEPPLTRPGARDASGRPLGRPPGVRPRVGRVVTPERAKQELADLRSHAQGGARLGPSRLEFSRVRGDLRQAWVYDEQVGAVVRMTVHRGGKLYLAIENDYEPVPEGYSLVRSTSRWFDSHGRVLLTAVKRFSAP